MIILVSMILLTCKATDSFSRSASLESISTVINETCVMEKLEQCARKLLPRQKRLSWVKCDFCHSWYHCVCIGISQKFFEEVMDFNVAELDHQSVMFGNICNYYLYT